MKKKNSTIKGKNSIVGVSILVICILILSILFASNELKGKTDTVLADYEAKQLASFNSDFGKQMDYVKKNNLNEEEGSYYLSEWLNNNKSKYNSNSVDIASVGLSNTLSKSFGSLTDLLDKVTEKVEDLDSNELLSGLLSNSTTDSKIITIKSNTVCKSVKDSKYCVNKLSANVYITDVNSSKWVVLIHPFMTNGELIYNTLGDSYQKQGYNVIAPDLRGFGKSEGSVAMGYLESLDIYDWIKDLNANWKDSNRYGVNVAPDTIIVHGISLGGATTLQLATNPDIAAANGNEPYTKNLTELNVVGFVDDCGYTSMSGIVTSMLDSGNTNQISSLLNSLDTKEFDFMTGVQDILKQYGIAGFDMDLSSLKGNNDMESIIKKLNTYKNFTSQYDYLEDVLSGNINNSNNNNNNSNNNSSNNNNNSNNNSSNNNNNNSNNNSSNNNNNIIDNPYLNGTYDLGNFDLSKFKEKYGSYYEVPDLKEYNNYIFNLKENLSEYNKQVNKRGNIVFQSNENVKKSVTQVNNNLLSGIMQNNFSGMSSDVLDGLVGTVLMDLVGVGLTEENYAKYSNVFSSGRKFPEGSKVVIIHGTADTTVPFSNSNTVANNVSPATLVKKWDVADAPHAFVVVGMKSGEYSELIEKFTVCAEISSCKSIN